MNDELEVITRSDGTAYFSMDSISVDEITGSNPDQFPLPMFNLKAELDDFGNVVDAGKPMNWSADWTPSETHWLKCGVIIPEHAFCFICGERDL
jgi:hypothetical protein